MLSSKLNYIKLKLFIIIKVKELVNYQLRLLKIIGLYLVFYIALFKRALKGAPRALKIKVKLTNLKT